MSKKNLSEYKRKYENARHHAWAGSVLLAVLLAIRIFLETSKIDDRIFIFIGSILVIYILIAVFFTYKYRSGLSIEQKNAIEIKVNSDDIKKEKLKLEKKKAKDEVKKAKSKNN